MRSTRPIKAARAGKRVDIQLELNKYTVGVEASGSMEDLLEKRRAVLQKEKRSGRDNNLFIIEAKIKFIEFT
jgi:hypothetical protein